MTRWFDVEGSIISILRGILDGSYELKEGPKPGELVYEGLRILRLMDAETHSFAHDAGRKGWSDKPDAHVPSAGKTMSDAEDFLRRLQEQTTPKH